MKTTIALSLFALLAGSASSWAAEPPIILAHAIGVNYGSVDTNVVVTTTEQKVFHFHSDVQGGGTWYDVFIGIDGKYVKVREINSVSATDKGGKQRMTSTERIFLLPSQMITKEEIELQMKNRIVLTTKK